MTWPQTGPKSVLVLPINPNSMNLEVIREQNLTRGRRRAFKTTPILDPISTRARITGE
jgi:hypothetical protein